MLIPSLLDSGTSVQDLCVVKPMQDLVTISRRGQLCYWELKDNR